MALSLKLENDKILVRPILEKDQSSLMELLSSSDYGKYSPLQLNFRENLKDNMQAIFQGLLQYYKKEDKALFSVIDKKNSQFIGFTGYQPVNLEGDIEQMYFYGFYKKYWGSSHPLEATELTCQYALNDKKISKLIEFVSPYDNASLQIADTVGFHFEKELQYFGTIAFLFSLNNQSMLQSQQF